MNQGEFKSNFSISANFFPLLSAKYTLYNKGAQRFFRLWGQGSVAFQKRFSFLCNTLLLRPCLSITFFRGIIGQNHLQCFRHIGGTYVIIGINIRAVYL